MTNHYLVSEELPPAPSGQEGRRITVRGYTQCPDATFNSFRGDMIAVGADSLRLEPEKAASTSGEAAYLSRAEVPTVSIRKISGSRTAWLVYGLVSVAFSIAVAATWESPTGL